MTQPCSISLPVLAWRGVRFYWRTQLAVFLGVSVAAAVLVGALLVGDSVRYSLRRFALLRLGNTELAMQTGNRFLEHGLAERLGGELDAPAAAVLRLRGTVGLRDSSGARTAQVNRVQVLGVEAAFWGLSPGEDPGLAEDEVALSRKLAVSLGAELGDEIVLRVGRPSLLPREAPLASRKERLSRMGSFRLARIIPDSEIGRFSLDANQIAPHNAFVRAKWLQERLELGSRANLLLVGHREAGPPPTAAEADRALRRVWRLQDVGISLRAAQGADALQLESDRVFLDPATSRAAMDPGKLPKPVGALTYLVNAVSREDVPARRTPYSFVLALSPSRDSSLSCVPEDMRDDEILVSRWLGRYLSADRGDRILVTYYAVLPSGEFEERERTFTVRDVVEMEELERERALTPEFPGLTDVNTCREWDVGMPMNEEDLADEANEAYWQEYGPTPKAIVTLATGQEMWSNRFGDLSAVRYAMGTLSEEAFRRELRNRISPSGLGLFFVPVREEALRAVSQSLDFGQLFLGMSFFLIVAALMLTGLLFVFGIEQRSEEVGTLLAVGFRGRRVRRLFLLEAVLVSLLGAATGAALGTQYTRVLIMGLGTYWGGAVAGAAIRYHAEPATIAAGAGFSFVFALAAVAAGMWRQSRRTARELLASEVARGLSRGMGGGRHPVAAGVAILGVAGGLSAVVYGIRGGGETMAPVFFAAGALFLLAGLGACRCLLALLEGRAPGRLSVGLLGIQNAARRPGRSLTAIGLLACGSFLVFAVSSMKEDVAGRAGERSAGTGGFELFCESTIGVPEALESDGGLERLNLDGEDSLRGVSFVSMKVFDGDDASCFNLNRAQSPRLIGVPPEAFSGPGAFVAEGGEDAWKLLYLDLGPDEVPGLAEDTDTALWGLKKRTGPEKGEALVYRDERGNLFRVKLVGSLPMRLSVFQGSVLIPLAQFRLRYPSEDGYRMFLADVPPGLAHDVGGLLARRLDRVGVDVASTAERLVEFYSVESTYLAMFLVLGGLGLLLGSIGMGIVVLRNVLERRAELAALRAMGFTRGSARRLLVSEHAGLLACGLVLGTGSALVALAPSWFTPGRHMPYAVMGLVLLGVIGNGLLWTVAATVWSTRGSLVAALRAE